MPGYDIDQLMKANHADFDRALAAANSALNGTSSPAIANLVRALAFYSRATTDGILAISQRLEDIDHNIKEIAGRLGGRQGPMNIR